MAVKFELLAHDQIVINDFRNGFKIFGEVASNLKKCIDPYKNVYQTLFCTCETLQKYK